MLNSVILLVKQYLKKVVIGHMTFHNSLQLCVHFQNAIQANENASLSV